MSSAVEIVTKIGGRNMACWYGTESRHQGCYAELKARLLLWRSYHEFGVNVTPCGVGIVIHRIPARNPWC